jgi:hypothetical protein
MRLYCGVRAYWYGAAIFSSVDDVHFARQFLRCDTDLDFVSTVTRFDTKKYVIL